MTDYLPAPPECEIRSSRVFPVPVAQLFRAWTEPQHLQNWWGPNGFTNTFETFDLRVGGRWKFVMHGPDKGHYPNEVEFTRIEAPDLISWKRHSKPLFQVVARFEALSPLESRVIFRMVFDTKEECEKIRRFAEEKNEENFDRLELELKNMAS